MRDWWVVAGTLAVFAGCDAGSRGPRGSSCADEACTERPADGGPEEGDSAPRAYGHDPSSCRGEARCSERLARESAFWSEVAVDGDGVEFQPTLNDLASSADAAVVARLIAVESGRVIQGDAKEDVYTELLVRAEVIEMLRESTSENEVSFSLVLPRSVSLAARDRSLERSNAALPIERVVLLLRWRGDADYFRLVNGYGLWAETTRSPLDAPILPAAPSEEPTVYDAELAQLSSMDDLIDFLR